MDTTLREYWIRISWQIWSLIWKSSTWWILGGPRRLFNRMEKKTHVEYLSLLAPYCKIADTLDALYLTFLPFVNYNWVKLMNAKLFVFLSVFPLPVVWNRRVISCLCRLYLPEKMTSGRLILKAASEATEGEIKVIQTIDYSQRCIYIYVKYSSLGIYQKWAHLTQIFTPLSLKRYILKVLTFRNLLCFNL